MSMNLANFDLICKLLTLECSVNLAYSIIFQKSSLWRQVSGSCNCISVNIYRFVAKMFMWDWFTGMLNYLGKLCLFSCSIKTILTVHLQMQWFSCYVCTRSYIWATIFKKHLKIIQLHCIFALFMTYILGLFIKCFEFNFILGLSIHAYIFACYSQILFATCYGFNTRHNSNLSCVWLQWLQCMYI